ncbi:hypothetical protein NIB75_16325 [Bacteroides uniformis]|nr:hypothetical protein [Bacteroides uniformis]
MVGGQNGTAQDKSGQGFRGTFFLPFFASDFNIESKIERNIPIEERMIESRISIKHDCRISIFQERMKAGKQD